MDRALHIFLLSELQLLLQKKLQLFLTKHVLVSVGIKFYPILITNKLDHETKIQNKDI